MPTPWSIPQIAISPPVRGPGTQVPFEFIAQSITLTRTPGSQADEGALSYVPSEPMQFVTVGALITVQMYGQTWHGVVTNGPDLMTATGNAFNTTTSSAGNRIELRFRDTRLFLKWDTIFGVFNREVVRMVNGERQRYYKHLLPRNYRRQRWTYSTRPLTVLGILNLIFGADTVGTVWQRVYHPDQFEAVAYEVDAESGKPMDELIQELNDACGLTMALQGGPFRLVWMRRGEGILSGFPERSDEQNLQLTWSGAPQRMIVVGDRNLYLLMNLPMRADWCVNYEAFWPVDGRWVEDIYQRGSTADGTRFNAIAGDSDANGRPVGHQLAMARALEITVGEYAVLRGDASWGDQRKFSGLARMNMPVWLYLQNVVFRAFRPPAVVRIAGADVVTDSMEMVDSLPARIEHDPALGTMSAKLTTVVEGNGYAIAQGLNVNPEHMANVNIDRFDLQTFITGKDLWRQVAFQIDQSAEDGRFIVFEEPIITTDAGAATEAVTVTANRVPAINAAARYRVPQVRASLAFLWDKYFLTWPSTLSAAVRDERVNVPGLHAEYLVGPAQVTDRENQPRSYGAGETGEIFYADGHSADAKGAALATILLRRNYVIQDGKYVVKLQEGDVLPDLNGLISRISVMRSSAGNAATIEFANERTEPGRSGYRKPMELDRLARSEHLVAGQAELRVEANKHRLIAQDMRRNGLSQRQADAARRLLNIGRSEVATKPTTIKP
jgi:hypothetical protein